MKKQKKLNLGKIKIAGINNITSIIGGVPTVATGCNQTCSNCETYEQECVTQRYCDTDVANTCGTTQQTRTESDACDTGGQQQSNRGEVCL